MDEVTPYSTESINDDITTTSLCNVLGNLLRSGTEPSLWRCEEGGGREREMERERERERESIGGRKSSVHDTALYPDSVMYTHITNT